MVIFPFLTFLDFMFRKIKVIHGVLCGTFLIYTLRNSSG